MATATKDKTEKTEKTEEAAMPTVPLKLTLKPFKGELPKRTITREREPNPFDEAMRDLQSIAVEKGESPHMLVEVEYTDPAELKPYASKLRSALRFVGGEGLSVRTWVVENGLVFQVGPKVERSAKEKTENGKK